MGRSGGASKQGFSEQLTARMMDLYARVQMEALWRGAISECKDPQILQAMMREVYLEIAWYQPDVIEATIAVIGQMPRTLLPKTVQSMLLHQVEEFDHGEMAVRDYVALGGSEDFARSSRPSPSAYAVAAYWRYLAHKRDPMAYLGALFLFEGLTPIVSARAQEAMHRLAYPEGAKEYIDFHATEDIKHQNLVRSLVDRVAEEVPGTKESMLHGLACFEFVYPIPCWRAAYERSLSGGAERLAKRAA